MYTTSVLWAFNITANILEVNAVEHVKINCFIVSVNGRITPIDIEVLIILEHVDDTIKILLDWMLNGFHSIDFVNDEHFIIDLWKDNLIEPFV